MATWKSASDTSLRNAAEITLPEPPWSTSKPVRRRSFVLQLSIALLGLGVSAVGHAALALRVVIPGDRPWQREALQVLQRRFGGMQSGADPGMFGPRAGPALYLAVTAPAFVATVASEVSGPIVAAFLSSEQYWAAMRAAPPRRTRGPVTALFAEASPLHQMQLIARIFQRRVSVGVLLTEASAHVEPALREAARETDLEVQVERVAPNTDVLRALVRVSSATVLLAVPDSALYTPSSLRDVLESTYRRGQPMIGFSAAMVHAGTLAAAYSSLEDSVAHLEEIAGAIEAGRVPPPQHPKYWRVAINEHVARSLNIPIGDDVKSMGNRPPERTR